MGKTYASDRAHQKRHFVRNNRKNYGEDSDASEYNVYAVIERSFKVDATRYGNERKSQSRAKVDQRRSDRRKFKQYEDE